MIASPKKLSMAALALGVVGVVGLGNIDGHGPAGPATAAAANGAVTPKTEAPNEARALSRAFSNVAKALGPSVVRIEVEVGMQRGQRGRGRVPTPNDDDDGGSPFRHFFQFGPGGIPEPGPAHGVGSGFIIGTNGDIVASLTVARLGDSEKLEVGEWVVAVGSPLGLEQTVTAGIVSGKGRPGRHVQMSGKRVRGYIQTDAKINPGNSGGPLVNLEGEVVGVNTLIQVGAGGAYGFAIPVNEVRRVAQLLIKEGRVRYPYLGLLLTDVKDLDDTGKAKLGKQLPPQGAVVAELTPGGPAGKAGVRPGDVITDVNNQKVKGASDVVDYVSGQTIGARVTLRYIREGKSGESQVVLGELPDEDRQTAEAGGAAPGKIGLGLQTLTPDVASSLGLDRGTRGAVITDVLPGSLVEVDRKPVASSDDAVGALRAPQKSGHLLRIRSGGGTRFVTIK